MPATAPLYLVFFLNESSMNTNVTHQNWVEISSHDHDNEHGTAFWVEDPNGTMSYRKQKSSYIIILTLRIPVKAAIATRKIFHLKRDSVLVGQLVGQSVGWSVGRALGWSVSVCLSVRSSVNHGAFSPNQISFTWSTFLVACYYLSKRACLFIRSPIHPNTRQTDRLQSVRLSVALLALFLSKLVFISESHLSPKTILFTGHTLSPKKPWRGFAWKVSFRRLCLLPAHPHCSLPKAEHPPFLFLPHPPSRLSPTARPIHPLPTLSLIPNTTHRLPYSLPPYPPLVHKHVSFPLSLLLLSLLPAFGS